MPDDVSVKIDGVELLPRPHSFITKESSITFEMAEALVVEKRSLTPSSAIKSNEYEGAVPTVVIDAVALDDMGGAGKRELGRPEPVAARVEL